MSLLASVSFIPESIGGRLHGRSCPLLCCGASLLARDQQAPGDPGQTLLNITLKPQQGMVPLANNVAGRPLVGFEMKATNGWFIQFYHPLPDLLFYGVVGSLWYPDGFVFMKGNVNC